MEIGQYGLDPGSTAQMHVGGLDAHRADEAQLVARPEGFEVDRIRVRRKASDDPTADNTLKRVMRAHRVSHGPRIIRLLPDVAAEHIGATRWNERFHLTGDR